MSKAETLVARLSPRLGADVHNEVRLALCISATVAEKAAAIRSDARLSPEGHREQIGAMLKKGPLAHLGQISSKFTKELDALKAERATFVIAIDPNNAVAEMQRQEARAHVRSLPEIERIRLATETRDPLLREAIATAPRELSGVPADIHTAVRDALLVERFGPKIANNAHLIEAHEEALTYIEEAGHDIRRASGLSDRDFAEVRSAA
jgi:hypothetical protein